MAEVNSWLDRLTFLLAALSFSGIGLLMAGYFLFPELATDHKGEIVTVMGSLMVMAMAALVLALAQAMGGG